LADGINRGSFSFSVFLIKNLNKNAHLILKEISFSNDVDPDKRNFCFWLYMHLAKYHLIEETLKTVDSYLTAFSYGYEDEVLIGVRDSIQNGELLPIG